MKYCYLYIWKNFIMNNTLKISLIAACSVVIFAPLAEASPVLRASVAVIGFNNGYGATFPFAPANFSQPHSAAHGDGVIAGLDEEGNPASMTITYDGEAQATAEGTLKARATLQIDNFFYNPTLNDPYIINSDFEIDPNGAPEFILLQSGASFEDRLSINGAVNLAYITLSLNIDGTLNSDILSMVNLYQDEVGGDNIIYSAYSTSNDGQREFDRTITSNAIGVNGGQSDVFLSLDVSVILGKINDIPYMGMDILKGTADFYNTLVIGAVSGFDVNGNPVDLFNATTSSGFEFDVVRVPGISVPEPWTISLLGFGLSAMVLFRRQRFI